MNAALDDLLVGVLLLASFGYAIYRLGPRSLKKHILKALRLNAASTGKTAGACGGCDNCGTDSTEPQSSSTEVKIPIAKIGRRA
jgi:hypothetical protein